MEHHPRLVFQYSVPLVLMQALNHTTPPGTAVQWGVKYPGNFSHALGAISDAGTEQASRGGVVQDLVLMNKEELLTHRTANCLGCSNWENCSVSLEKRKEGKKQTKDSALTAVDRAGTSSGKGKQNDVGGYKWVHDILLNSLLWAQNKPSQNERQSADSEGGQLTEHRTPQRQSSNETETQVKWKWGQATGGEYLSGQAEDEGGRPKLVWSWYWKWMWKARRKAT